MHIFTSHYSVVDVDATLTLLCAEAQAEAKQIVDAYNKRFHTHCDDGTSQSGTSDIASHMPTYTPASFYAKCKELRANAVEVLKGLGTLGGGNHFIEVNEADDEVIMATVVTVVPSPSTTKMH
jgi:hypothetical protein